MPKNNRPRAEIQVSFPIVLTTAFLAVWCLQGAEGYGQPLAPQSVDQSSTLAHADVQLPRLKGDFDQWHGFDRIRFNFQGRNAHVVAPKNPVAGNPWVWRARFPSFHAEADQLLLGRGFHIAYLDTNGLLGSPQAMEAWNAFYNHLVDLGFSKRVALEGVSRGGLFIYGFASRWPQRVSCLYADTPVCDLRSWPGGFGVGRGSPAVKKDWFRHYGIRSEDAKAFSDNPIDRVGEIAKAKIPILHVISMNDQIVPPAENTLVLRERLNQHGHEMTIVEVSQGTEASGGHHFTHPDPARVADFIERHTIAVDGDDSR